MKCVHCGEEIMSELFMVMVSADGDFVHEECEKPYNREKEHFLNVIVRSEELTIGWLLAGSDVRRSGDL